MKLKYKWLMSLVWILFIFVSLPFVRSITDFLRAQNLLRVSIAVIFVCIALAFGRWLKKNFKNITAKLWLYIAILSGIYGLVIARLPIPEEQFHLVQYGMLVFLVFQALRESFKASSAYFLAFVFTSLVGWADEGVQYLLPNRYYELKDVLLNCLSAVLGMGIIFIVNQINSRGQRSII